MARAEVDMERLKEHPQQFLWDRMEGCQLIKRIKKKQNDKEYS